MASDGDPPGAACRQAIVNIARVLSLVMVVGRAPALVQPQLSA